MNLNLVMMKDVLVVNLYLMVLLNLDFIPDICHMIKLARNALADFDVFVFDGSKHIEWQYITMHNKIQLDEYVKHKLWQMPSIF